MAALEGREGQPEHPPRRQPPGRAGVVGGQPGPSAHPRSDVLRRAVRASRGHPRRRPRLLHRLARLAGEPLVGVDVRGLVWRSHRQRLGFTSEENRKLGRQLQARGAEVLLDMRVRWGGSHHQKMVVIRHADDPTRDIAYVGGIDLCHSRRDDADHGGDPQAMKIAQEYGDTPPWHDVQAAISGPAVYDVETVFRERWEDPTPLSRSPINYLKDRFTGMDLSPDPLPEQAPPPPAVEGGSHVVQLLRTYPDLRLNRDYAFARG